MRLDNIPLSLEEEVEGAEGGLFKAVAVRLGLPRSAILGLTALKRSIDTRGQPRLIYSVHVEVERPGSWRGGLPEGVREAEDFYRLPDRSVPESGRRSRVVVVGAGPAGLFAALALARAGLRPTLLEQGKPVETRAMDVSRLMHWGELQNFSNLCFGEGGAGTWSDGKLTTRIGAPQVRFVLETLVEMGAPSRILIDGKPHLGTDRLVALLKTMRAALIEHGAEVRFGVRVEDLAVSGGRVVGVKLSDGEVIDADRVVLAAGHSARALLEALAARGVAMSPKAFAVGFRVEHPQQAIDAIQYGRHAEHPLLPPADYRLSANFEVDGHQRGVYSFCMCPGGQVVPTPTEADGVVVNGMSHAARSGAFANSALVVTVEPGDFGGDGLMAGFDFQRRAERRAGAMGGGLFRAPAQTVSDFLADRSGGDVRKTSYTPGVTSADLSRCYPDFVTRSLKEALRRWGRRMPAFVAEEAVLIGVETRTSAPIQVERGADLQSTTIAGLYPCGEGSGHGGGIVSAAVDGLRVADAIVEALAG